MSSLYVAYALDDVIGVIKANSKEEALDIFASKQMSQDHIQEFVTSLAVNDGLLEEFYQDNQGWLFDSKTRGNVQRIQHLSEVEQERYIDSWIAKNAREFWSDTPELAEEYLEALNNCFQSAEPYIPEFSHDFWINTTKKIIQRENWYEAFDIVEIDLGKDNYQEIYDI